MARLQNVPEWVRSLVPAEQADRISDTLAIGEVFEIEDLRHIRVPEYEEGAGWFLGFYSRGLRVRPDGSVSIFLLDGEGRPVRFAPQLGPNPDPDLPGDLGLHVRSEEYPIEKPEDIDRADEAIRKYVESAMATYLYWASQTGLDPLELLFRGDSKKEDSVEIDVRVGSDMSCVVQSVRIQGKEYPVALIPWGSVCLQEGLMLSWDPEGGITSLSKVGRDLLFRQVSPKPGNRYTIVLNSFVASEPTPEEVKARALKALDDLQRKGEQ